MDDPSTEGTMTENLREPDSPALHAASARTRLAGFWNSWFYPHEIEKARAFAETATDEECQVELDRLGKQRDSRLAAWKWSQ